MHIAPHDFEHELVFEGCFNFRDVGGYPTTDGRWVRTRRLFRADGPHALTERDCSQLRALRLATVIDLRTIEEADERGSYASVVSDATVHHLPLCDILPDAVELPTWIEPTVVARRYREMLDAAADMIGEALAILSDPSAYPAMFHCRAGKDRTGILAAVILGVLGVDDDTIVADYALSGDPMKRLISHLHVRYPEASEQIERVAPAMIAADPLAMAGLIRSVRGDYGSFEGYATAIGVGTAPGYLRDILLR